MRLETIEFPQGLNRLRKNSQNWQKSRLELLSGAKALLI